MLTNERNRHQMLWGNVSPRNSGEMTRPASVELRYHRHEAPWPLRKMIFVVACVSLALWVALFMAVL